MEKARFVTAQPPVTVKEYGDKTYVFICLNGVEKAETVDFDGESRIEEFIEYDYNEFSFVGDEVDIADVQSNPEKYLNYPVKVPTEIEQLRADVDYLLMLEEG